MEVKNNATDTGEGAVIISSLQRPCLIHAGMCILQAIPLKVGSIHGGLTDILKRGVHTGFRLMAAMMLRSRI